MVTIDKDEFFRHVDLACWPFLVSCYAIELPWDDNALIVPNQYIVSFRSFSTFEHDICIAHLLKYHIGWKILPRIAQSQLPTPPIPSDILLLQIDASTYSAIETTLLACTHHIRSIVPQKRLVRTLHYFSDQTTQSKATSPISPNLLPSNNPELSTLLQANELWNLGFKGQGVKVAIFDTGLALDSHFPHLIERTNWTDEVDVFDDILGHGTFIAGILASSHDILGIAPDIDLYSCRLFDAKQHSYTSWFLDAFNYAIYKKINIINLSMGGLDFLDQPFSDKVAELCANNIIIISAVGNDGPIHGTIRSPADSHAVIGVGSVNFRHDLSSFSSRGMTTWGLSQGLPGHVKPDILTYGQDLSSFDLNHQPIIRSGTSFSSPIITGAIALLASTLDEKDRWQRLNLASIKRIFEATSKRLPYANIYEQGHGELDLISAYHHLHLYDQYDAIKKDNHRHLLDSDLITFSPSKLDLTSCPYMWPYCDQPLYHSSIPVSFSVRILNAFHVSSTITESPKWIPGDNGHYLRPTFTIPSLIWPWSGSLSIHFNVIPQASKADCIALGQIALTLQFEVLSPVSSPSPSSSYPFLIKRTIYLPVKVKIIPIPARSRRILWDQFHNISYPMGHIPSDILNLTSFTLKADTLSFDSYGDHLYTNFRHLYKRLRKEGYYIDILTRPFTCFSAKDYGTLMIVDTEDEFHPEEIDKLYNDVTKHGLSLAIFGDWYNAQVIDNSTHFDSDSERFHLFDTGGSNIPAMNDLLRPFGIQFGDRIYDGVIQLGPNQLAQFHSGTSIIRFPRGGKLFFFSLKDQLTNYSRNVPILGFYSPAESFHSPASTFQRQDVDSMTNSHPMGRIAVFGDSSCLEYTSDSIFHDCLWLATDILRSVII